MGEPVDLFLRLQGGRPGFGIRPGADALQLCAGLSEIPHLRVAGLLGVVAHDDDGMAMDRSMAHTKSLFRQEGFDPVTVLISNNVMRGDRGGSPVDYTLSCPTPPPPPPSGVLAATVVSRPSLNTIVIGIVGYGCGVDMSFPDHPHLRVVGEDGDCLVVSPNGMSDGLTIGQSVRSEC